MNFPLSFDALPIEDANANSMGNLNKVVPDWKFWLQLIAFGIGAGMAWEANQATQAQVKELLDRDGRKTETIIRMEGDLKFLRYQIDDLQKRLESKKVVGVLGVFDPVVSHTYLERDDRH